MRPQGAIFDCLPFAMQEASLIYITYCTGFSPIFFILDVKCQAARLPALFPRSSDTFGPLRAG